jgi:hypothetical protein
MTGLASRINALIGAVVTIAAFIALITSETLKTWVKHYSYWVAVALVIVLLALWLLTEYAISLRRRLISNAIPAADKPLDSQTATRPSAHDSRLYSEILTDLPPDGMVMSWLKNDFVAKYMSVGNVDSLDQVIRQLRLKPIGFDDPQLHEITNELIQALSEFSETVTQYYQLTPTQDLLSLSGLSEKSYQEALWAINNTRESIIISYNLFFRVAHEQGLDR